MAWAMARRTVGLARSHLGRTAEGVELCRDALAAAPTAQARALAMIYFCAALLDDGRNLEAVNAALDEVAEGHLAGLDYSFGGYLDAQAAEGLIRLGRWAEAEATLARHMTYQTLPVGILRVARAGAMLAARRGDTETATRLLADATARPTDGFHQTFLDHGVADVHLALGNWAEAAAAAERGWETHPRAATLWGARFAMLSVAAAVEQTLDALASGQPVDVDATVNHLQQRIDDVQADTNNVSGPTYGHRRPPCPRNRQPHPPDRPGPGRLVRSRAAMEGHRRRVVERDRHAPRGRRRRLSWGHGPCRRSAPGRLPHGRRARRSRVGCAGGGDLTSHPPQCRSTDPRGDRRELDRTARPDPPGSRGPRSGRDRADEPADR